MNTCTVRARARARNRCIVTTTNVLFTVCTRFTVLRTAAAAADLRCSDHDPLRIDVGHDDDSAGWNVTFSESFARTDDVCVVFRITLARRCGERAGEKNPSASRVRILYFISYFAFDNWSCAA